MKPTRITALSLATALLLSGAATAADKLPISQTGGIINVSLPTNQVSLMALPLTEEVAFGTVTATGATLTLVDSLGAALTLGDLVTTPHAIKITSDVTPAATPSAYGKMSQITANAASTVTTAATLDANVGDEFVIFKLETIGSVFGATNTAGLNGGSGAATADIIYLDSAGTLTGYFYKSSGLGGTGWRLVSAPGGSNQDGVIVEPGRSILVQRIAAGSTVTLTLTGDAVSNLEAPTPAVGLNVMNNPWTIGTTLAKSGIQNHITGSSGAATADILYLESGGVLTGYFYKNSGLGGTGWRLVTAPSGADQGTVSLPAGKAILFQEQAGSAGFAFPEPFNS